MKKSFYLTDRSIDIIEKYRYENHLKNNSVALDGICSEYAALSDGRTGRGSDIDTTALVDQIISELIARYDKQLSAIDNHSKFTDRNVQVILEVLNTMLSAGNYTNATLTSYAKHKVIRDSEYDIRRRISENKQKVDNQK